MVQIKKYLFFVLVILISSCSKKAIKYCTAPNYSGFCYEFRNKNRFKYYNASCLGVSKGIGKYSIVGDSIIFHFENCELEKKGNLKIIKNDTNDSKLIINLRVVDIETNEPLGGNSVKIYNKDKIIARLIGDLEGRTSISTSYKGDKIRIELSYIGYPSFSFNIDSPGKYNIVAKMDIGITTTISKQDRAFNLIKMNDDTLVIRHINEDNKMIILTRQK